LKKLCHGADSPPARRRTRHMRPAYDDTA
jgi:hypothetical protein